MRHDAPDAHLFEHDVLPRAELDALLGEYRRLADEHGADSARALRVRNRIIAVNMRLVAHMAKRYRLARGMDRQDLHAYGVLGLITAIERFDLSRGNAFNTYACWWVRHAISRALADLANVVRVPVHAQESAAKEATKQRAEAARAVSSLDAPMDSTEGKTTFGDMTADPKAQSAFQGPECAQVAAKVHAALERLPERLQGIVRARMGEDGATLKDVGDDLGLSRERVRQLEREAFAVLRLELRSLRDVATS